MPSSSSHLASINCAVAMSTTQHACVCDRQYAHQERVAVLQTRMISGTGVPTIQERGFKTLHQDDTIASRNSMLTISVVIMITPPIHPTPTFFSNSNIHSTVNPHSNVPTKSWAPQSKTQAGSGPGLSVVGHGSGVQRDRNPW